MKTMPATKIFDMLHAEDVKERNRIARAKPRILNREGKALVRWYSNFLTAHCLVCGWRLGKGDDSAICKRCHGRLPEVPNFIDNRHPVDVIAELPPDQPVQEKCCKKCKANFNITAGDIVALHNRYGGYRAPRTCPRCLKAALDARKRKRRNGGLKHSPFKKLQE